MQRREDRIRELAQVLSSQAGNPPNRELDFWLEAEELHDQNEGKEVFPRELYANFMRRFFDRFEKRVPIKSGGGFGFEGDDDLGHRFLLDVRHDERLLTTIGLGSGRRELFDVSLLAGAGDFEDMAKRSLLMSDTSLLGADTPPQVRFYSEDRFVDDYLGLNEHEDYFANFKPSELTPWLEALKQNLTKGDIFILPRTSSVHVKQAFGGDGLRKSHLFEAIVQAGKIKSFTTENIPKQKFLTFLAEVPIPTINDVPLSTFAMVYNDNIDEGNHLKEALRERFFELDLAKSGEMPETALKKIGNKLAKDVRVAATDLQFITNRGIAQAAGVAIGTGVATLAALNVEALASAGPLISGAGGLAAIYKAVDSYLESRAKKQANPFLFLWLIKRAH